MTGHFTWAAETHVGHHREHNEDQYAAFSCPLGEAFVVCDGMGGHAAGEVAARLAVERIKDLLAQASSSYSIDYWLRRALHYAHQAIQEHSQSQYGSPHMGTTAVVLLLTPTGEAWWAHTGDSRLYLYREGKLHSLTHDHSLVSLLVDTGYLSPEGAFGHPQSNQLLFSLGGSQSFTVAEATTHPLLVQKGDRFLLCSDGLSGLVPQERLAALLEGAGSLVALVKNLVEAALQAGGYDNVTVLVVQATEGGKASMPTRQNWVVKGGLVLAGWLAGVGSGAWWVKNYDLSPSPKESSMHLKVQSPKADTLKMDSTVRPSPSTQNLPEKSSDTLRSGGE